MSYFSASLSDISSNARVKVYPSDSILQVANDSIFREPGYEPRKRPYAVPSKGHAADSLRSILESQRRARSSILDIAKCNQFSYFATLTFSPQSVDRYDVSAVQRLVLNWLKNASCRKGFQYLCIPEKHKDGAIHLHCLCNLGSVQTFRAYDPHRNKPLSTNHGQPVFNLPEWRYGYSTAIPIDENYERTCNYLSKYITKGSEKIFGKWYYSSRQLTKKPEIQLVHGGIDYMTFRAQHPDAPEFPVYRDIRITSIKLPARCS